MPSEMCLAVSSTAAIAAVPVNIATSTINLGYLFILDLLFLQAFDHFGSACGFEQRTKCDGPERKSPEAQVLTWHPWTCEADDPERPLEEVSSIKRYLAPWIGIMHLPARPWQ